MRNSSLALVRSMVKSQTGKSTDASATAQDAEINQIIANCQDQLAATYDWPFLKSRWDSFLTPGTRFQTVPTTLSPQGGSPVATATIDFESVICVAVKWNNIWQTVIYGIDEAPEFNYLDSDRNQVLDPVQRWQFSDETKFEVWPLPASNAQIRFIGQRELTALGTFTAGAWVWNDAALCDMDDTLLAYMVAVEYFTREQSPALATMQTRAQKRLDALLGHYPTRTQPITIGRGQPFDRKAIRQVPLVLVAGK
jgi:hypothetical protein